MQKRLLDKSKDYTNHRSLCTLSKSGSKIFKPAQPETIFSWRAAIQTMFLEEKWTGNRSQLSISGTRKKISEKMPGMYQNNRMAASWHG